VAPSPPAPDPPGWAVLLAAPVAGVVAATTLVVSRPGLGWLLTGLAIGAAGAGAAGARWRRPRWGGVAWAVAAIALLTVGVVRDAGWLYALCVPAAVVAGVQAAVGPRTVEHVMRGVLALPVGAVRALPWTRRGVHRLARASNGRATLRLLASIGVGLVLLWLFGALFASADPAFAKLLWVLPSIGPEEAPRWILLFPLGTLLALATAYLVVAPPPPGTAGEPGPDPRRLGRFEWSVPVAMLDVLFLAFVVVQAAELFGGDTHVQDTAGLTYAGYARGGFWQLCSVTVLTLGVVAVAAHVAPRAEPVDRVLIRALLGALAVLTLVIVASASRRMALYESAYGWTRLRLFVGSVELWLGLLFVFVLVAGVRLRAGWLTRAALATAVGGLLALAAVNPDRFIAARNVDRFERTGHIDQNYLSYLSADAAPELDRLPAGLRACVLVQLDDALAADRDDWRAFNLGRATARQLLRDRPANYNRDCTG
jgi:hypothetical protein